MVARGVGYGKVILFGEHFVVYGLPAIAAGIPSLRTVVEVSEGPWPSFDARAVEALKAVARAVGVGGSYSVRVLESVPQGKNFGSSAALMVAFARALNELHNLGLSDEEISRAAYEGEKVMHGSPSGIDNTCATYGKPIIFRKTPEGPHIQPLEKTAALHLGAVAVGEPLMATKEAVSHFRSVKERSPLSRTFFKAYEELFQRAVEALSAGNVEELGLLMDFNHALLQPFGVSSKAVEEGRFFLKAHGALGAKLTGAGTGGNIIALFPDGETAKEALERAKAYSWPTYYLRI